MQDDKAAIRNLLEDWADAVRNRDYDRILRHHSPDISMFDLPPPLASRGIDAYRKTWDLFFSDAPVPAVFEIGELEIFAGSNTAFAVALMRCTEPGPKDGRLPLDFRLTVGLQKIGDAWTIVHEHHSVPAA